MYTRQWLERGGHPVSPDVPVVQDAGGSVESELYVGLRLLTAC